MLKETETNEKYILNTNEFSVDVEYNKTSTLNIENEHKKGNVKVYKIDKHKVVKPFVVKYEHKLIALICISAHNIVYFVYPRISILF